MMRSCLHGEMCSSLRRAGSCGSCRSTCCFGYRCRVGCASLPRVRMMAGCTTYGHGCVGDMHVRRKAQAPCAGWGFCVRWDLHQHKAPTMPTWARQLPSPPTASFGCRRCSPPGCPASTSLPSVPTRTALLPVATRITQLTQLWLVDACHSTTTRVLPRRQSDSTLEIRRGRKVHLCTSSQRMALRQATRTQSSDVYHMQ